MVTFVTRLLPYGDPENYAYGVVRRDTGSLTAMVPSHPPTLFLLPLHLLWLSSPGPEVCHVGEGLLDCLGAFTGLDCTVDFC